MSPQGAVCGPDRLYYFSYMLETPGKAPILIDTGITAKDARKKDFAGHDAKALARVVAALHKASHAIVLTPGTNREGGLSTLADADPEKAEALQIAAGEPSASAPYAIAPGVVVIPTPDRRPGTRLVYVRLADDSEYLFMGDLSPTRWNLEEMRAPARFVTWFRQDEDRQAIYAWLSTAKRLKRESPGLTIVSGNKIPKDRGLQRGFPAPVAGKQSGGNRQTIRLSPPAKAQTSAANCISERV